MSKLEKTDLGRSNCKYVRMRGSDMQKVNDILARWLRACLRDAGGDFMCLELIMAKLEA
jgi:hypothetical protein